MGYPGVRCPSTYCRMMLNGAPPHDAAKYDGDHRCSRWVRTRNRWQSRRADTPLSEFTSAATGILGGYSISRWTWPSSPLHSTRTAPKSEQTLANTWARTTVRHRGPAPGGHAGQGDAGAGLAGRGVLGSAGAGVPGRAPRLPQLSTRWRASVRAARSAAPGFGPARTIASRSGSPATASGSRHAVCGSPRSESFRWRGPDLPAVPSSATVVHEADGQYYVSFVVERETAPLPATTTEVGIDLGLDRLLVTSAGAAVANPATCGPDSARWLGRSGRCAARRRARSTVRRPGSGSRSSTGRLRRPGWTPSTRSHFDWSATTKRPTSKTWP